MAGFLLGAAGMFATMYSTQAILPELGREFGISPAEAGLSVSVVVLALAVGAWVWGPLSDRYGRRRAILLASGLLVLPTIATGLAPTFPVLLLFRALQGLCMPGLLTVGVPYVMEAFGPAVGGLAMGSYVAALVAGGLLGRVGVALLSAAFGWRWAVGGIAVLPAAGMLVMRVALPSVPLATRSESRRAGLRSQLRNPRLLQAIAVGSGLFFTFVGTFSYVVFRLDRPSATAPPPVASSFCSGSPASRARSSAASPTGSAGAGSPSSPWASRRRASSCRFRRSCRRSSSASPASPPRCSRA